MTLCGVLKNILIVVASVMIWGTVVTGLQIVGYGIASAGLVYYGVGYEGLVSYYTYSLEYGKKFLSGDADATNTLKSPAFRRYVIWGVFALTVLLLATGLYFGKTYTGVLAGP